MTDETQRIEALEAQDKEIMDLINRMIDLHKDHTSLGQELTEAVEKNHFTINLAPSMAMGLFALIAFNHLVSGAANPWWGLFFILYAISLIDFRRDKKGENKDE